MHFIYRKLLLPYSLLHTVSQDNPMALMCLQYGTHLLPLPSLQPSPLLITKGCGLIKIACLFVQHISLFAKQNNCAARWNHKETFILMIEKKYSLKYLINNSFHEFVWA